MHTVLSLLLTLLSITLAAPAPASAPAQNLAPRHGDQIPGKYIVRLKQAPGQFSEKAADLLDNAPTHTYQYGGFHGFAAELSSNALEKLKNHPNVAYIQPDTIVQLRLPRFRVTHCWWGNPDCQSDDSESSDDSASSDDSVSSSSSSSSSMRSSSSSSSSTRTSSSSSSSSLSQRANANPTPSTTSKSSSSSTRTTSSAAKTSSSTKVSSSGISSTTRFSSSVTSSSTLAAKTSSSTTSSRTSSSSRSSVTSSSSRSSSTFSSRSSSKTSSSSSSSASSTPSLGPFMVETNAPWNLARLSNKHPGTTNYTYSSSSGAGVCVYVVDTGIDVTHPEFEGRAIFAKNFVTYENATDLNGHGTHVAGTIGSLDFGVAKRTSLFAVKFLDANGTGTYSNLLSAFDFVVSDSKSRSCSGVVLNLSAGGPESDSLNDAANNVVANGIFFAVAAGNDNEDAANDSPASASNVFAVGATDENDARASFSNYGAVVDIFAPGVDVLSTYKNNEYAYMDGTSMATPHISGLAAYILALEGPRSPAALGARLQSLAQKGLITGDPAGTVNYLAFNGSPYAQ